MEKSTIEDAFSLLDATLEARAAAAVEMVVIGGAAMNLLGYVARPTKDVDVLALGDDDTPSGSILLVKHTPLPAPFSQAAASVALALGLDEDWLNAGPADLNDQGLPTGFEHRLVRRFTGRRLTVLLPSREDLICFKVYAAADTGVGRHTEDLRALAPTCDELLKGARWARTQDPSEGFREMLQALLKYFSCDAGAEAIGDDD